MTTKDEALKMALDALTCVDDGGYDPGHRCGRCDDYVDRNGHVRAAIREALAQKDEQEPVAWIQPNHLQQARIAPFLCRVEPSSRADFVPLYTAPPKRKPLTDEQIREIADSGDYLGMVFADGTKGIALDKVTVCDFARAVEAAHGIGGQHDAS